MVEGGIRERNRVIEAHYRDNYKRLVQINGGKGQGEDVVQEAYCNALKYWPEEGMAAIKDMDNWIGTLATNCSKKISAVERRRGAIQVELDIPAQQNAYDVMRVEEVKRRIAVEPHPDVLSLYFIKQWSSKEVAEQVKLNHSTIRSVIAKFRREIKDLR